MEEKKEKRFRILTSNTYFRWGFTIFCAGALLVLFYQVVSNFTGFKTGISDLRTIISPFIYGFVMAYLLSPVYNYVVRKCYPVFEKKTKKKKTALTISKVLATIIALVVLLGIVAGLLSLLIPQVADSVRTLTATLPNRFEQLNIWLDKVLGGMGNQDIAENIDHFVGDMQDNLLNWLQDTFLPGVGSFMQRLSNGVLVTIKTFFNVIIGVIACAYFLNGKENFRAQFKKVINAFFSKERATAIHDFFSYTNRTFGSFITGKIIDSVIIGVLCFVAMSIMKLPYPILISTIVGVTNIIPFFGPFIGAIPSIAIIFIVSPVQALYFLILVIVLQQLDGNIIGPAILGSSIGIGSFWVMFAIVIGGGLFGFIGMVLGVPIFALIYHYAGMFVGRKLGKKGQPQWTKDYLEYDQYEIDKDALLMEVENAEPPEKLLDKIKKHKEEQEKNQELDDAARELETMEKTIEAGDDEGII